MAVYGPGDIDPSTGQPYPADPESVATYGLTLPHSGFGAAPATPMTHGIAPTAGYPVTESGAPTPGHIPNYGPAHAGGSPTNQIIPDSSQSSSPDQSGGGYSIWDLGRSIKNWMGQPSLPTLPAAIGEAGNAAPGDTGGVPIGGGAAAPGGMPWAGNQGGQPATSSGMPWAGNNAGRPYGVGAPGGRVAPGSVNLGRGVPGIHPAVIAHAAAAAAQQNNSPFIGISRPNADVVGHARGYNSGVQGTALDLSRLFGGAPPPAAAPTPVLRPAPAPVRRAPVRGPLHPAALGPASTKNYPVTESGSPTPMDIQDQSRGRTFPKYNLTSTPDPGSVAAFGGGVWGGS